MHRNTAVNNFKFDVFSSCGTLFFSPSETLVELSFSLLFSHASCAPTKDNDYPIHLWNLFSSLIIDAYSVGDLYLWWHLDYKIIVRYLLNASFRNSVLLHSAIVQLSYLFALRRITEWWTWSVSEISFEYLQLKDTMIRINSIIPLHWSKYLKWWKYRTERNTYYLSVQ